MNNYTELIDQYLNNALSNEEKQAFEKELSSNKFLRKEFEIQKNIMEGLQRAGIKYEFSRAIKQQLLIKGLTKIAGLVLAVSAIAICVYLVVSGKPELKPGAAVSAVENAITPEKFNLNTGSDTVIETKGGIVFAIPSGAFNTAAENIELEIREALSPLDIIKQGLSTTSDGRLLQTAGMFCVNAYENGKQLDLVKRIQATVPTDSVQPGMMLFDGKIEKDGRINWVNPKPLDRTLTTVDIKTLDFYPEKYIPTLEALGKNTKNRKYTDSLYYSFSGYGDESKMAAVRPISVNQVKPILMVGEKQAIYNNKLRKFETDQQMKQFIDSVPPKSLDVYYPGPPVNNPEKGNEIDPSRIKAIWNEKFDNTLLATKEFEQRLKFIFTTCNPGYLGMFVNNLSKPLYVIDSMCAAIASGSEKAKFLQFAGRGDGGVKISDRLQNKLSRYFSRKYEAYKMAAEKSWNLYYKELETLENKANDKRIEQSRLEVEREEKIFGEEFCLNLVDAYRQLGEKKECPVKNPVPAKEYYHVEMNTTGWKNLDQYVFEATQERTSLDYVAADGRKASITYTGITVSIQDVKNYDRILAYLIPDSLSSFQRMNQAGDIFTEKLNSLLKYDLLVVAYQGEKVFYGKKSELNAGNHHLVLSATSENVLMELTKSYSRTKRIDFKQEIKYQAFEHQETVRQLKLQKDMNERTQIIMAIFPCFMRNSIPPTAAPAHSEIHSH